MEFQSSSMRDLIRHVAHPYFNYHMLDEIRSVLKQVSWGDVEGNSGSLSDPVELTNCIASQFARSVIIDMAVKTTAEPSHLDKLTPVLSNMMSKLLAENGIDYSEAAEVVGQAENLLTELHAEHRASVAHQFANDIVGEDFTLCSLTELLQAIRFHAEAGSCSKDDPNVCSDASHRYVMAFLWSHMQASYTEADVTKAYKKAGPKYYDALELYRNRHTSTNDTDIDDRSKYSLWPQLERDDK